MKMYKIIKNFKNIKDRIYSKILSHEVYKCVGTLSAEYPVYIKGEKYISFGKEVGINRNTRIEAWDEYCGIKYRPKIIIGNNVVFNPNCHIGAINKIIIGNNVLFGAGVLVTDHSHGKITKNALKKCPNKRVLYSKGEVKIEDNVWIGEHVAILPGVTIGKNSIIAANAVVTHDVPMNVVAAGVPAKVQKYIK